ncbi:HEXXH motif domain-containing protein [Micromonospora polyrhachis]|uniref:HEXXH motif-containing protein n=1 Tax=Micromonospora polyrhachis TaxID=1282883 RepID=A0A7W7SNI6_9ACTN|nr:HEXXH motif domain-containing protein [Micromonospora polyrhachis]MBB4958003.1 HEXXH motif-containing protein [Micromonospora polyrhachis]
MESPFHQLAGRAFAEFSQGGGGPAIIRSLLAGQYSKNLLLLRAIVELTTESGHRDLAPIGRAYSSIQEIRRYAPQAARTVLTYPSVSAWAMTTVVQLSNGVAGTHPGRIGALATAVALQARVPVAITLPATSWSAGALALPSLGRILLPQPDAPVVPVRTGADGAALTVDGGFVSLTSPDDPGRADRWTGSAPSDGSTDPAEPGGRLWQPVPRLSAAHGGLALRLRLDDLGAFSGIGEQSPKPMGRAELAEWQGLISSGWRLLVEGHRPYAEEIAAAITMVAPLRTPDRGQVSGTFRNAVGCVAMSRPADHRSAAVTLVHELQHTKLSALMNLFPLVEPGPDDRFHAPWRTDRRPLAGLLQGLYAHLGVAAFWRRQARHESEPTHLLRAQVEFARWREACREVADLLLETGRLSRVGRYVVGGARRTLAEWQGERLPTRAVAIARRLAEEHRARYEETSSSTGAPGQP